MIPDSQGHMADVPRSTDGLQKWKNPTHHQVLSTVSKFPKQRMVGEVGGRGIFGYFAVDMSGPAEVPWVGLSLIQRHWASSGPRTPSALIYGLCSQQVYTLCGFVFIALLLQELVSYLRHINLLGGGNSPRGLSQVGKILFSSIESFRALLTWPFHPSSQAFGLFTGKANPIYSSSVAGRWGLAPSWSL